MRASPAHTEVSLADWMLWTGEDGERVRLTRAEDMARSAEALLELQGKPGVLVLDDLAGYLHEGSKSASAKSNHVPWSKHLDEMGRFFHIVRPVLPVHLRHKKTCDDLLPIIADEIKRLPRPLTAVVDMQWRFTDDDNDTRSRWFGLELIRLIKKAKPSLPVYVWSQIDDRQILQRAMQLGAASCFSKAPELSFMHDRAASQGEEDWLNELTAGKLWLRLLEWEATRYQCPPVGSGEGDFILAGSSETKECRQKFIQTFELTESQLLQSTEPEVVRLLRALVPNATSVEILRFFGEGQGGAERPFVVRGRTASGRWLRPVQIKLGKDWRALAREGKGYRDVFAGCLGPSVAHVLTGPFRLKVWCGMSQSFAAPEEAIRNISSKSTRSLDEWLREKLGQRDQCRQLVNEVFDGVLDPLYKGNLTKLPESMLRAFDRVCPAHLEQVFQPPPLVDLERAALVIDLTPEALSRKDERARRELAFRQWRKAEDWWRGENKETRVCVVKGLVIESLEPDKKCPVKSRLRLLDRTLGVKVDLTAGSAEVSRRWESLAESNIKLVGLPVAFALKRRDANLENHCLLGGWTSSVEKLLEQKGVLETSGKDRPNRKAWRAVSRFFHPGHPVDWTEELHVGPTHGDLNLGNILLHGKGGHQFPWLIDFDKAADQRPVVFDLAKLEVEAVHKIMQEMVWELRQYGCLRNDAETRDFLRRFEELLGKKEITGVEHLWPASDLAGKSAGKSAARKEVPESLKQRFSGLFAYLQEVHKRVEDLGISRREFLLGRAVYALCCLKFKHLYDAGKHPNAPFPAKVLLWKLEALLEAVDAENGIVANAGSAQLQVTWRMVMAVREARSKGEPLPLEQVLKSQWSSAKSKLKSLPDYMNAEGWELLLRLLRDKQLPGKNRWMRELLWYARDHRVAQKPAGLAEFTAAIVRASMEPGTPVKFGEKLVDYASTGRLGNAFPTRRMFEHLATNAEPLIKVSSRGDSGGTIDILEKAGIRICRSKEAAESERKARGWAVVETSEQFCEVDNLLMKLRKSAHCMKVSDLAMASISAKKAALGIPRFEVQVVSGYDAKFSEFLETKELKATTDRWQSMWKILVKRLDTKSTAAGEVSVVSSPFNSNSLGSWFSEIDSSPPQCVVFGSQLLAAHVWMGVSEKQRRSLGRRLPAGFVKDVEALREVFRLLQAASEEAEKQNANAAREAKSESLVLDKVILDLTQVDTPASLAGCKCRAMRALSDKHNPLEEVAVLFFTFKEDVTQLVQVPFFDGLYAEIAESKHSMASIVFGRKWLAILRPRTELEPDLQTWCWRILREGFEAPFVATS